MAMMMAAGTDSSRRHVLAPGIANLVAVVVTAVWAVSFLADILVKTYTPPPSIHTALMIVLGGLFGTQLINKGG